MEIIQVDGGQAVVANSSPTNSIGVLYPAERVDFIVSWAESTENMNTEIIIELDDECVLFPLSLETPLLPFTQLRYKSSSLPRQILPTSKLCSYTCPILPPRCRVRKSAASKQHDRNPSI